MEILRYVTELIETNIYIIIENEHAVIIDSCCEEKFLALLDKNNVTVDMVILTHEHNDHISGVEFLRKRYGIPVIASRKCGENVKNSSKNFSRYFNAFYELQQGVKINPKCFVKPFTCNVDMVFDKEKHLEWQGHDIYLRETPGHSPGGICILLDNKILFSGDTLLPSNVPITRFPGGSKEDLVSITLPFIKNVNADTHVYPGHGEEFVLKEHQLYQEN